MDCKLMKLSTYQCKDNLMKHTLAIPILCQDQLTTMNMRYYSRLILVIISTDGQQSVETLQINIKNDPMKPALTCDNMRQTTISFQLFLLRHMRHMRQTTISFQLFLLRHMRQTTLRHMRQTTLRHMRQTTISFQL